MRTVGKPLKFAVLAVDVVLCTVADGVLKTLLMKVERPPYFKNIWGFPGGLIKPSETAEEAAARIVSEKGGIKGAYLEQLATFSQVDRDPRGRVVSVAYLGLIAPQDIARSRGLKTETETEWCPVLKLPHLAYDHDELAQSAYKRLQAKIGYTNIVCKLLPREFSQSELQGVYEIILNKKFDKRNFRKKVHELKLVQRTGHIRREGAHRPAELFRFSARTPREIDFL